MYVHVFNPHNVYKVGVIILILQMSKLTPRGFE